MAKHSDRSMPSLVNSFSAININGPIMIAWLRHRLSISIVIIGDVDWFYIGFVAHFFDVPPSRHFAFKVAFWDQNWLNILVYVRIRHLYGIKNINLIQSWSSPLFLTALANFRCYFSIVFLVYLIVIPDYFSMFSIASKMSTFSHNRCLAQKLAV